MLGFHPQAVLGASQFHSPAARCDFFQPPHARAAPVLSLSSVNTPTVRVGWEKSEEKVSRPASNDLLNYRDLPHCHRTHRRWNTMTKMYKKRKITPGCARPRARAKRRPGAACSADLSPPLCSDQRLFVKINFISRELPRGFGWVVSEGVDFAAGANKFWALAFLRTACHSKLPRRERRRRRECVWKWAVGVHQFWNQLRRDGGARLSDFSH